MMGTTSSIKNSLFGETEQFSQILKPIADQLGATYPNAYLRHAFSSLPSRSITVGPMSMCARLAADLGTKADEALLRAIGVMCFHISTHDDLIDEPPAPRNERAALLYAGNISFIKALLDLVKHIGAEKAAFICSEIQRNHFLQQQCVDTLWTIPPQSFEDYLRGVQHDGALIGIGVKAALVAAEREELWPQLEPMCTNYGIGLQLLDDINEVEEDAVAGYHSYPISEGVPFADSFSQVERHITMAEELLEPEWKQFGELLENVRMVKNQLHQKLLA